jgi:hypothetical protein
MQLGNDTLSISSLKIKSGDGRPHYSMREQPRGLHEGNRQTQHRCSSTAVKKRVWE